GVLINSRCSPIPRYPRRARVPPPPPPRDPALSPQPLNDRPRRDFLKQSAAGVFAASYSGWMNVLAARAAGTVANPKAKARQCILLWMDGGPSHKDTLDLKPDSKGAGEFKPIKTSASGIEISEHLPGVAKLMHHA